MKSLSERKHNLLIQAIEDYIKDASPITSGSAKQKYIKDISTATLRNELNSLEQMGYLKQLHTSSGRIPTTEGYRYYVNHLLKGVTIKAHDLEKVKNVITERANSFAEIVSSIAEIVSKATNYPTVIYANGFDNLTVEGIKIVPLINNSALALIKTQGGYINNTINVNANEKSCYDASIYLTKKFMGKTIKYLVENMEEVEKVAIEQISGLSSIVNNLVLGMKQLLEKPLLDIRHEGTAKLIGEYKETQKIVDFLENEEEISKVLKDEVNDVTFEFAEEGEKMEGCAIVKAPIMVDGKAIASIGVVGPQRMDYCSIASALKLVMHELDELNKGE